jgi:hypothetical protein
LLSGSQIQNPQFQAYQGQQIQAAPIFQATQAEANYQQQIYAQQVAQYNAMIGGISNLAGAGLGLIKPFKLGGGGGGG